VTQAKSKEDIEDTGASKTSKVMIEKILSLDTELLIYLNNLGSPQYDVLVDDYQTLNCCLYFFVIIRYFFKKVEFESRHCIYYCLLRF
jgi:hypothetical protein